MLYLAFLDTAGVEQKKKTQRKASENAEDWSNFSAAFALVPHYATGNLSSTTSIEDKVH